MENKKAKEDFSLTKSTLGFEETPSKAIPYISEVDKVGFILDLYKTKTQEFLDEGIREKLEAKKSLKLQNGPKLQELIDLNYKLLQEMEEQRTLYGNKIQKIVKKCTSLVEHKRLQEEEGDNLSTASSIRTLLSDINK